jgi:uncharacterized protein YbcV (DUF1398 family)
MDPTIATALDEYTLQSHAGTLLFPDFVGKLAILGVERYHTDYCRHENTYYLSDGHSHVVAVSHPAETIGTDFRAHEVEAAIRESQRNEHSYADFLRKTMAAGCVGYFVQIAGRQALYFGRRGEVHIEPFPTTPHN